MSKNLVICGMPGVGKSTIGKRVAELTGYAFVDTDILVEKETGLSCREYFQRYGEAAFRKIEKEVIFSLRNKGATVISLGGGAVEICEVVELLPYLGIVVHLSEEYETLQRRKVVEGAYAVAQNNREFNGLFRRRLPIFNKIANIVIQCHGKDVEVIAKEVEESYVSISRAYSR